MTTNISQNEIFVLTNEISFGKITLVSRKETFKKRKIGR